MKRWIAILVTLAMLLCGMSALAEEDFQAQCDIEDGGYVIRIPDENGDLGWLAEDPEGEDAAVKLERAELEDGAFVARYAPVADGETTVAVKHYYTGFACDQVYTFDLVVKDGVVQENVGGSYTANPDDDEIDPYFSGRWVEVDTQFTSLDIVQNESRGWDVEIAAPLTHGAYIFKTTIYYDCDVNSFVYDKGKYWEVPITDSDEEIDLGEAAVAGTTGSFTFTGDPVDLRLTWVDDLNPDREVEFEPFDAVLGGMSGDYTYYPESEAFVGLWKAENCQVEIVHMLDDYALYDCIVTRYNEDGRTGTCWIYDACAYDDIGEALTSMEIGMKFTFEEDENGDLLSNEDIYDDGAAAFAINDEGKLVWTDFKETPGENEMVFEKAED